MKNFVLAPAVQFAIILAIAGIVITAFLTHQTTSLGAVLTAMASAIGMFLYRAGWLHGASAGADAALAATSGAPKLEVVEPVKSDPVVMSKDLASDDLVADATVGDEVITDTAAVAPPVAPPIPPSAPSVPRPSPVPPGSGKRK